MKKRFTFLIILAVFLSLLITSVGVVEANGVPVQPTLPNPQLTLVSGGPKLTSELLSIVNLPGLSTLASGMLAPAGFPAGSKQFEGLGVKVSDFAYGTIKACFPMTATNEGWGGQVGMWDGSSWKLLPTQITPAEEAPYSWACATIYDNSTYAFIKWVVDPSKLPTMSACSFGIDYVIGEEYGIWFPLSTPTSWVIGLDVPASIPPGTPATFSVYNVDPNWSGTITSGKTGRTSVGAVATNTAVFANDPIVFSQAPGPSFMVHYVFPTLNCYVDLSYYEYLTNPG